MNKLELPKLYSQWDSRWAEDVLGYNPSESHYTIYNYGCLISCIAMTLEYTGYPINPHFINEDLKSNGGFLEGTGLYIWGSSEDIYGNIKNETVLHTPDKLTDADMNSIYEAIDNGNPVMLQIDYNPKTVDMEMHYVLCIGYDPSDENNLLIADPLGGLERSLKDYLGWYRPSARNTIYQYIIYDVVVPTKPSLHDVKIDWDDAEGNRHTCGWYEYEWYNEKTMRLKESEEHTVELNDKAITINSLTGAMENAQKEVTKLTNKIGNQSQQISDQKTKISRLETQNASLMSVPDLIKILLNKIFS